MSDNDIQKGFEREARLVVVRMPKKITKQEADEIADALADFLDRYELTQGQVAKAVGVSSASISQFLNKKYKANAEALTKKLIDYMDGYSRRRRMAKCEGYIRTNVARFIEVIIKNTHAQSTADEGKIGIIIGDAGHGKSVCLREYAAVHANVIYAELDDTMTSKGMFAEICKAAGVDDSRGIGKLTNELISCLGQKDRVVILDEASALTVKKLSQLRQIITVRCKCPLILSANNHLLGTMNQSMAKRGNESLDQFKSRVTFVLNLDEMAVSRRDGLYTRDDIRKLYERGGIKLAADAVATLRKIARTPQTGRLRTCSHAIAALRLSSKVKPGTRIDTNLILNAIRQLGLPVMDYLPVNIGRADEEKQEAVAKTA
ncbi:MAG: hypothetical protein DRP65_00545 [Planctomycetota bacterium]|nr:MAG: hypothetical protein DRP65_00545 [Planctomycetota bacterium]